MNFTGLDETCIKHRGVEQLVAHRAHNPEVVGSNPTPATNKALRSHWTSRLFSCPPFSGPVFDSTLLLESSQYPVLIDTNVLAHQHPISR